MPYRIDIADPPDDAVDRLASLGALDMDLGPEGLAAIMPDSLDPAALPAILGVGVSGLAVSAAVARDEGSVWVLRPQPVRAGRLVVVPADATGFGADALRLADSGAFGTGLHPTTALCLELLDELLREAVPPRLLDVGTGSGVLALAALRLGVPHVHALDIDADALRAAGENARLNGLQDRVSFQAGGPEALDDAWPFIVANILAAPLIDMAPTLVRRVARGGQLLLSGIPADMAREVERVYCRLGMRPARIDTRAGWSALVAQPSW